MYILTKFTDALPKSFQPYAKALYPTVGTIVAVAVQAASIGVFDTAELTTALTGGVAAIITLLIPNKKTV